MFFAKAFRSPCRCKKFKPCTIEECEDESKRMKTSSLTEFTPCVAIFRRVLNRIDTIRETETHQLLSFGFLLVFTVCRIVFIYTISSNRRVRNCGQKGVPRIEMSARCRYTRAHFFSKLFSFCEAARANE